MARAPSEEDWNTTLAVLEAGLDAAGIPMPLALTRRIVAMIKRRTQDGQLDPAYARERALELVEEAIEPLAGAALDHAADLDELKRGQDQIVELVRRVIAGLGQHLDTNEDAAIAEFEGPRRGVARTVAHFKGRAAELGELERLLVDDPRVVCVVLTGVGGIGKTVLTQEFVATRAPELFPEGAVWLDGTRLVEDLVRASRRFGWRREHDPGPDEAAAFLAKELHARQVLIVVDDFDPARADAKHVPLPGGRSRTVVTSRSRTVDIEFDAALLELDVWRSEVCRDYLRERCQSLGATADAALDALADFVGRLPLGLRLLVSLLRRRRSLGPAEILAELETHPAAALDAHEGSQPGIAKTFQASYDALTEGERRVLRALAICAKHTSTKVVAHVVNEVDVGKTLDALHDRGLVEFAGEHVDCWSLHNVVWMFLDAMPRADDLEAMHLAWVRRHLRDHAGPRAHDEFECGVDESIVALGRVLAAGDLAEGQAIFLQVEDHLEITGRLVMAIELCHDVLQSTPANTEIQAHALIHLGISHFNRSEIDEAIAFYERALASNEALGRLEGQAAVFGNLGGCHGLRGEVDKAIDYHQRSLAINVRIGHIPGQAASLNNLGGLHRDRGDVAKAIAYHGRALALADKIGELRTQAGALGNLGLCHDDLGDHELAIDYHTRCLALEEQIGYLQGQAETLLNLGNCCNTLGRNGEALSYYRRALDAERTLDRPLGQAQCLGNLGNLLRKAGQIELSYDLHLQALQINEDLGRLEGQAVQLGNLGLCLMLNQRPDEALEYFERSLALSRQLGRVRGQATQLRSIGYLELKRGNSDVARPRLMEALGLLKQLGLAEDAADVRLLRKLLHDCG